MAKRIKLLVALVSLGMLFSALAFAGGQKEQPAPSSTTSTGTSVQPTAAATTVAAAYTQGIPAEVVNHQADLNDFFPNGIGSTSYKGVHLVAVTQTGPQIAGPLQEYKAKWEEKTGATVEVQTFPFGDLFQKIRTAFLSGATPSTSLSTRQTGRATSWGRVMWSRYRRACRTR